MRLALTILATALSAGGAGAVTLSGRVTDTNGGGIHPVDVDVRDAATGVLLVTPGDSTDALGFYAVEIPTGSYDVSFRPAPGSHWFSATFAGVSVVANKTLNATLVRGHYVSGRAVRASNGQGVPLVDLDFRSPATGDPPNLVEDCKTDPLGYFQTLVDSALWDVSWIADAAQRLAPLRLLSVDLRADQNLGVLSLLDAFLLQGTVTDVGFFPVADADLDVRPAGGGATLWTPQDNTDDAGEFALILQPGSYDITATPPQGFELAPVTARSVVLSGDLTLSNLALPPAVELRGRCKDPFGQDLAGVDVDVDSLPNRARLETPGDHSDAGGEFRVLVPAGDFRVTLSPAVADRLLPVRFDSLHITGARDMGDISFASGHWVSGTVTAAGVGTPIAGANLDLRRLSNGVLAITPGDVTDGTGFFRITTDQDLYRLTVIPPSGDNDTLVIEPFRTLGDTAVALELPVQTVDVVPLTGPGGEIELLGPRPNPGRDQVTISFTALGSEVELSLWDVAGRHVVLLYRGEGGRDRHLVWSGLSADGRRVPAGVYVIRLVSPEGTRTRRLVWLP